VSGHNGKTPGWEWGKSFHLSPKPCIRHGRVGCSCGREAKRQDGKLPGHDRRGVENKLLDLELERLEKTEWDL